MRVVLGVAICFVLSVDYAVNGWLMNSARIVKRMQRFDRKEMNCELRSGAVARRYDCSALYATTRKIGEDQDDTEEVEGDMDYEDSEGDSYEDDDDEEEGELELEGL